MADLVALACIICGWPSATFRSQAPHLLDGLLLALVRNEAAGPVPSEAEKNVAALTASAQPEPARSARPAEMHIHCTYDPTMRSLKPYVRY